MLPAICIINITSIAGRIAIGASGAYAASKFALEAFTESWLKR